MKASEHPALQKEIESLMKEKENLQAQLLKERAAKEKLHQQLCFMQGTIFKKDKSSPDNESKCATSTTKGDWITNAVVTPLRKVATYEPRIKDKLRISKGVTGH